MRNMLRIGTRCAVFAALLAAVAAAAPSDPLPSWNDGPTKQAIVEFVQKITDTASRQFVPPAERIATFDNDGTLWPSHPMYTQLAFALDRIKALAPKHPEWKTKQPFKAVLDNDLKVLAAAGEKGLVELIMASHAGMSTAEFEAIVTDWLMMLVFHDDAQREYAYGPANGLPETKFGTFPQSLMDEAKQKGWVVISMKNDWKAIFANQ
jgi:hypothetical protein